MGLLRRCSQLGVPQALRDAVWEDVDFDDPSWLRSEEEHALHASRDSERLVINALDRLAVEEIVRLRGEADVFMNGSAEAAAFGVLKMKGGEGEVAGEPEHEISEGRQEENCKELSAQLSRAERRIGLAVFLPLIACIRLPQNNRRRKEARPISQRLSTES